MRILFVNPCLRLDAKRRYPPVGLACILTACRKAGIEFDLFDMDALNLPPEGLRDFLKDKQYDVCALGAIVSSFKLVKHLITHMREHNRECTIIAGNSVASSVPEILLRNTEVDIGVMAEGDITIVDVLDALRTGRSLSTVNGIAYLDGDTFVKTTARDAVKKLDDIGFPDWDLFDLKAYNPRLADPVEGEDNEVIFPLNAARGCPYKCTFCYHVFIEERYRKYSETAVMNEIRRLHDQFGATFIHFWDELTFPSIPSVERMIFALDQLPFRVRWQGITRGDLFKPEHTDLVKRMKDAGCESIAFSIENANAEILKAMKKRINIEQIVGHTQALLRGGVTPFTSIIFGYPQETPESIKETLDLAERCGIFPSVGFLQPLPGTPMYEYAIEHGFITDQVEYLMNAGDRQDFHVNMTKMPTDELIGRVMDGMQALATRMGLQFDNPLKTSVYQKPKEQLLDVCLT